MECFFFNFLLLILFFLHIILIYLSTYLLVMLHGMAYGILVPQTRDQTHTPCIGNTVLTTGPPGKSQKKMDSWNIQTLKFKKKKKTLLAYICAYLNIQKRGETMDEKKDSGSYKILATAFKMQFIYSML